MLTNKEKEFLARLYSEYYTKLIDYSYSLLDRNLKSWPLAEDCVQSTFEKAMIKMNVLQKHDLPYLWLRKTCRNITLSENRKLINRARILRYPISFDQQLDVADPKDDIAEWILREELIDRKQQLLENLTEQERMVYQAIFEENLSHQETEKLYSMTDGTIRGAIQRIKRKALKIFSNFLIFVWCFFVSSRNV